MGKEPLRILLKDIGKVSVINSNKSDKRVGSIGELDDGQFRKGLMNCVFSGRKSIPAELVKYETEWFEEDVSSYVVSDRKIRGLFLFRRNEDDELELETVLLQAIGADYVQYLMGMIRYSYKTACRLYPEDTVVVILRNSPESEALSAKFFPGR